MRFKKYFMCEDCNISLVQAGHEIHNYINNSDCPRCGKCLMSDVENANKRYAHCVMSSLIFYSKEFSDLVKNVEKCVENCEHNTLINENKREYSLKQWKNLASLIQEKKYEKLNLSFLDVPEQKKLNQMLPDGDATDSQSQVDTETDGLYSLYDETSGSSKDSKSPKPF